eukprot:SAG11_NODE_9128_length_940_cov_0.956005_1_plen_92_part_00
MFSAPAPLGPYTFQRDISTIPGATGNASTCAAQRGDDGLPGCVYAWRSQATGAFVHGETTILVGAIRKLSRPVLSAAAADGNGCSLCCSVQ